MSHIFYSQRFTFSEDILSLYKYFQEDKKNPVLLFSGTDAGRYSFLGFEPGTIIHTHPSQKEGYKSEKEINTFMEEILNLKKEQYNIPSPNEWDIPFCGGWMGAWAYDFIFKENISLTALWAWYEKFIVYDHQKKHFIFAGYFQDKESFTQMLQKIKDITLSQNNITFPIKSKKIEREFTIDQYEKKFEELKKYIHDGKSFQINFSQYFKTQTDISSTDIFRVLIEQNPAPMMILMEWGNFALLSSSPERLFSSNRNREILTQPIAGTRKKGADESKNAKLKNELLSCEKEKAEHAMMVDLLRNDFGRVCKYGSVEVKSYHRVEEYANVFHLVSDIIGIIDDTASLFDVIDSLFPGGTITGAPKHETIKILKHIEETPRGFYCGSGGYISLCESSDINILIRTIERYDNSLTWRAGGGIVIDGIGSNEYQETINKSYGISKIFTPVV